MTDKPRKLPPLRSKNTSKPPETEEHKDDDVSEEKSDAKDDGGTSPNKSRPVKSKGGKRVKRTSSAAKSPTGERARPRRAKVCICRLLDNHDNSKCKMNLDVEDSLFNVK